MSGRRESWAERATCREMAMPAELGRYDALIDLLVEALVAEFEAGEEDEKRSGSDDD